MRRVIALTFELTSHFHREICRGVQEYGIGRKQWAVIVRPQAEVLREWPPAGLIAHLSNRSQADELLGLGIPLVDTALTLSEIPSPRVGVDEKVVGKMAADYLLRRGHRYFSYFYDREFPCPANRGEAFLSCIRQSGVHLYSPPVRQPNDSLSRRLHPAVLKWLRSLPKPAAIFVGNDIVSAWLSDLCQFEHIRVPEDVALLGVGNDEIFCLGNYPNLSSIELPGRKIGFEAAKILDRLMSGQKMRPPNPLKLLLPVGVVTRHSTDADAFEHPAIASTLRYIREHIAEPFSIPDIARALGVSRRLLEIACRKSTNMTLLEQIHSFRIERAKTLLAGTAMKVADIAEASGFTDSFHLRRLFAKYENSTPSEYREKVRIVGD